MDRRDFLKKTVTVAYKTNKSSASCIREADGPV